MRSALSSSVSIQGVSGTNIELFVTLGLIALIFAGLWKVFEKAGKPGWAAIIPIYNLYVLVKVSGNAWYWFALFFVPVINFFATLKVSIDIAGKFIDILLRLKAEESRGWDIRVYSLPPLSEVGILGRGHRGGLLAVPTSRYSYLRPIWTKTRSYFR